MSTTNIQFLARDVDEQIYKNIIKRKQNVSILIIEEESKTAGCLHKTLSEMRFHIVSIVSSVEEAWAVMWRAKPDLVLMNKNLEKKLHGVDVGETINQQFDIPVIYIGSRETETGLIINESDYMAGFLRKPIQPKDLELSIAMALYKQECKKEQRKRYARHQAALEKVFYDFTKAICCALEHRDSYTAGHQKRVAELALLIGKRVGLEEEQLKELHVGGMLHDIGKIGIPMDILTKSTGLTEMEFGLVKSHVQIGFDILKGINFPWSVKDIVLNHHELLDGSGYPNGIGGDKISYGVRIITVSDVVEAMSTMRPYRAARSSEEVIDELRQGRRIKYDAEIVDTMIELIKTGVYNPW